MEWPFGPDLQEGSATARWVGAAIAGAAAAVVIASRLSRAQRARNDSQQAAGKQPNRIAGARRDLNAAAALLATSVLLDSAVEHYRGSFENPGMLAPLMISGGITATTIPAALRGSPGGVSRTLLFSGGMLIGTVGVGFHLYNLLKRPGGFSWLNLFYAAPLGAPAALMLAGLVGLAADHIDGRDGELRLAGLPADIVLASLAAAGIAGTASEAALLHYRGAFQNPFMLVPVTIPPTAAATLAAAAWTGYPQLRTGARHLLLASAAAGIAGVGFHAYGISRAMGGWRNWSQNVLDGPPLPAPPAFAALSLVGLLALSLSRGARARGERQ